MKNKKQKIRYGPKKASCNARPAVVLLVVLFVVMAITIFSLGYITSSDTALIAAENVKIRNELDYLAESGLEHARGLLLYPKGVDLGGSPYWTGASGQQLLASDDYYDVNVAFTDTGGADSYYSITSTAYREVSSVRIAESIMSTEIPINMPTEVKYWKLDAGTGTVLTDSSANAIQGWWYGGSATYMRWNTGLFGSSITFDGGVADFSWIRGNSAGTLTVASASISLWMCMPVTYQADGAVAEFRTSNPDNASYTLEVGSTAQLWLRKTDGGGTTNLVGPTTTALNDGQWHHVVFTLDNANSKAKIYVDGVLDAVSTSYSSTEDPYHVRFGSRATSPAAWYSGRIDEILTYDQPLNQLHVTYLFSKGPGPCTPSTMHIEEIECDLFSVPGNRNKGMATVKVYDNCVGLVSGATVTGTFTGDYTDAGMSAVTDDAGRAVILTVQEQPGQGNFFTFCVDSVTHGSYSHAQGEDLESCDTN